MRGLVLAAMCAACAACGVLLGSSSGDDEPEPPPTDAAPDLATPIDGNDDVDDVDEAADVADAGTFDSAVKDTAPADACDDAGCVPELVATVAAPIETVVQLGGKLFVTAGAQGSRHVLRLGVVPGTSVTTLDPVTNVATDPRGPVAAYAGGAFWATPNGLRRDGPDGAVDLDAAPYPIGGVLVSGTTVYWSEPNAYAAGGPGYGKLAQCTLPDCTSPTVVLRANYPYRFVQVGARTFWTGIALDGGVLALFDTTSGAMAPLAVTPGVVPAPIATDGKYVVWAASDGVHDYDLDAGKAQLAFGTGASPATGLAFDPATQHAWVAVDTRIVELGPGIPPTLVVTDPAGIRDVAFDATYLYYGTASGQIFRLLRR
jgi:hypothetical protein